MPERRAAERVRAWLGAWLRAGILLAALVILSGATGGSEGEGTGGVGGLGGGLLLLVGAVVAGGILLLGAAYLVLRWRAGPPQPASPGDWWTCQSCGAANIVGSPRCHSCGSLQG